MRLLVPDIDGQLDILQLVVDVQVHTDVEVLLVPDFQNHVFSLLNTYT